MDWNNPACWQTNLQLAPDSLVAGVDEVGRGALFGPVVAAAVILPIKMITGLSQIDVRDSKKLSAKRRLELAPLIPPLVSGYHISFADVPTINHINIRQASLLAMERAAIRLPTFPAHFLVDGREKIPNLTIPQTTIIQGDNHSVVIGAASILAKVWRDSLIIRLAQKFPGYDLAHNKGYGTLKHRQGIQQRGLTPLHRAKFCRQWLVSTH